MVLVMEDSQISLLQIELIKKIVKKNIRITITDLWLQLFIHCKETRFQTPSTPALRELFQLHEDIFVFSDDSVSLKHSDEEQKLINMASPIKKELRLTNGNVVDLAVILKKNISKKENEIVQILIKLINEKPKMTLSMLAANMSSLSKDHHSTIGHGHKALVKYLKKYPEVFCIIGDTVSISTAVKQQLNADEWLSSMTGDSLHQVRCTVTKIGPTFGFLAIDDESESTVYFTSYVFEGGNSQDLTKLLKMGDAVVVDAEKGDPNSTAEWRAKKVVRVKRQGEVTALRQERGSSLDHVSLRSHSDCSEFEWETSDNVSVASSSNMKNNDTSKHQDEIVKFLKDRIVSRNGKITVQNLTGHLSSLDSHLRKYIGCKLEDLRAFLQVHNDHFVMEGENVALREAKIETVEVNKPAAISVSDSPLERYDGETATIFSIDASSNGILKLPNEIHAYFDSSVIQSDKTELKKGMIVTCNAVRYPDRWEITKIWHSSIHGLSSDDFPVSGHVSTVVRIFPEYGFIAYGEHTEDNIYFQKGVIEGIEEYDLTVSLPVGSKVICDAVSTSFYSSKYRAIRVIPLIDDGDWTLPSVTHQWNQATTPFSNTEELYFSDDESGRADATEGKLRSYTGRVMNVYETHGFIQRGAAGKDPENVYFNTQSFITKDKKPIRTLTDAVQIGDTVSCNYELAGDRFSCRWRATAVWKNTAEKSNGTDSDPIEVQSNQCGTIIKVYPSKGIISFGPHMFLDRVFFGIETFYFHLNRVSNLMHVLKVGDSVQFDASIDEGEVRMKWKAIKVWVGIKPGYLAHQNDIRKATQPLKNKKGVISMLNSLTGLINYGPNIFEVYFTKDIFYDNGQMTENLERVLKVNDEVFFEAEFDQSCLRYQAVRVWKENQSYHLTDANFVSRNTVGTGKHAVDEHISNFPDKTIQSDRLLFKNPFSDYILPSQSSLNALELISLDDDDHIPAPDIHNFKNDQPTSSPLAVSKDGSESDSSNSQHNVETDMVVSNKSIRDDTAAAAASSQPSVSTDDEESTTSENDNDEETTLSINPKTSVVVHCINLKGGHLKTSLNELSPIMNGMSNQVQEEFDSIAISIDSSVEDSLAQDKIIPTAPLLDNIKMEKPTRCSSLTQLGVLNIQSNELNSKSLDNLSTDTMKPVTTFKKCIGDETKQIRQDAKQLVPWCDDVPKEKWIPLTDDDEEVNDNDYTDSFPTTSSPGDLLSQGNPRRKLGLLDWQANKMVLDGDQNTLLDMKSVWDTDDILPGNMMPNLKDKEDSCITSSGIGLPTDLALWTQSQVVGNASAVSVEFEKAWSVCFENLRHVCDASKLMMRNASQSGNLDVHKVCNLLNGLATLDFQPLQLEHTSPAVGPIKRHSDAVSTVATQTLSTGEILSQHIYSGE